MDQKLVIRKLMQYVGAHPGTKASDISKATGIGVQTYGTLKFLEKETMMTSTGERKEKLYSIVGDNPGEVEEPAEEKKPDVKQPAAKAAVSKPSHKGARDTTKYRFDGVDGLSKGKLALALIQKYVSDKKPTFAQLEKAFEHPDLKLSYGLLKLVPESKRINENSQRTRFYTDHPIKCSDKSCCITNQWTSQSITILIGIGRKLKYTVK
jgi:hypothetical protein